MDLQLRLGSVLCTPEEGGLPKTPCRHKGANKESEPALPIAIGVALGKSLYLMILICEILPIILTAISWIHFRKKNSVCVSCTCHSLTDGISANIGRKVTQDSTGYTDMKLSWHPEDPRKGLRIPDTTYWWRLCFVKLKTNSWHWWSYLVPQF